VKPSIRVRRASHVNTGTAVPPAELPWPTTGGRVLRLPRTHVEVDQRSEVTPYGGLALATEFVRRFKVAQRIDQHVRVFKLNRPYHESDHVLAQAFNLYVGGTCIEDVASLQHSEAVLRILGACRIPDPTTAGDFLRRLHETEHQLPGLRRAIDEVQAEVWRRQRRGRPPRNADWSIIDVDGHVKPLYGVQKQGAEFHKSTWCYQPLVVSLAGTGECLAIRNRPGNIRSSDGTAAVLDDVLPQVQQRGGKLLVRGDSDFDRGDIRAACRRRGAHFAFVGRAFADRPKLVETIAEPQWRPFRTRAHRAKVALQQRAAYRPRCKRPNRRRACARARDFKELRLVKQWLAELPQVDARTGEPYRLVIRRQLIEIHKGQQHLFDEYRYRYIVTDLPATVTTQEVVDLTYERCDQENVIAQLGSGLAAWRMPVAEFDGNSAWLEIARLAWNLGKWIAQLVLPDEVVRWEWKRFRQAFVYAAAQVVRASRQIIIRFSAAHRWFESLVAAHRCLQT
jgi:Transposase DDE domain group 1